MDIKDMPAKRQKQHMATNVLRHLNITGRLLYEVQEPRA
jgi:hypothetical protein